MRTAGPMAWRSHIPVSRLIGWSRKPAPLAGVLRARYTGIGGGSGRPAVRALELPALVLDGETALGEGGDAATAGSGCRQVINGQTSEEGKRWLHRQDRSVL